MTKVQLTFKLNRSLTDDDLKQIAKVHSVYGMFVTKVISAGQALFVEYDASRLSPKEVRATLEQHGLPLT
jgi:allophanate hydrolase subunit 1